MGALSPADPPALHSLPPAPCHASRYGGEVKQGASLTKPCASTAPGECRKGTNSSIHPAKAGQDQAGIMGRIKRMGVWFPRSKWAKVGQGLPWCRPPALLPRTQTRSVSGCLIKQGEGQKRVFPIRYKKNTCQGIMLDRQEYSCVRNDYIYMCAPTFIHGSAGVFIVYRKIFVYISSPDISSVDTSSGEVYSHPSACMHLSAHSRSMVATGSPFHAA